jgi:2-phosphosulfolactate phosphatase
MKKIEICLTPELVHLHDLKGKIVVVTDILRATSCIVAGLASGVIRVKTVTEIAESIPYMAKGYVRAGERNGEKIEGFDIGNSPFEHIAQKNKSIVMTTTNGTQAIKKSITADKIIIGAFLNISAVAHYLDQHDNDVVIMCSGWKGRLSMEDTLFAGALYQKLAKNYHTDCDAVLAATTLYEEAKKDIYAYMTRASHFKRLERIGISDDLHYCLQNDLFDIVPIFRAGELYAE